MTDTARTTYRLPSLNDLTLNDAFAIKAHTGVDVLRPPTVAHGDAAMLWFVSKDTDEPLVYKDLIKLTFTALSELIEAEDDEAEDVDDAEPAEAEDVDDAPKASTSSSDDSSPSPAPGNAHPPTSGAAPSANWD